MGNGYIYGFGDGDADRGDKVFTGCTNTSLVVNHLLITIIFFQKLKELDDVGVLIIF